MSTQITPRRSQQEFLPDLFRESSFFSPSQWLSSWRSPFREMNRMQERMERMMNEMMAGLPFERMGLEGGFDRAWTPACTVNREEDRYVLNFDLPGVRKEDIDLQITEDQLIVSGKRASEKHEKTEGRELVERTAGHYYRSFALPADIEKDHITANYENGVLEVTLPHPVSSSARRIPISEGLTTQKSSAQKASSKVA
jgi:HSP20 family protein